MIILFVLQYCLPLALLAICYTTMSVVLWSRKPPGNPDDSRDKIILTQRKKSVKMMISVVVTFGSCWLPWHLFHCCQLLFPMFKRWELHNINSKVKGFTEQRFYVKGLEHTDSIKINRPDHYVRGVFEQNPELSFFELICCYFHKLRLGDWYSNIFQ